MSIKLSTLLDDFCDFIADRVVSGVADSGSTTTLVDAALNIYGDGHFEDYYIYITSGNAKGDVRRIQTFTKASGTVEPYVDFSAAIAAGNTYQIKKTNTQDAKDAINDAIVSIYPKLFRKIVFESLGLSLLTSNASSGQKNVIVADATLFFAGQGVTIADDNASEDATIDSINATTNTLTMEDNLTNAYTTAANAKVTADSGHYFNLGATIGQARVAGVFVRPDSTSKRMPFTECEVIQSLDGDRQLYFPASKSVDDQTWIIEAKAKLEAVSDPDDTITLEDRRVKLLYAEVAYHFFHRQANLVSAGDQRRLRALALDYRDQVGTTFRNLWMAKPVERADLPDA